LADTVVDANEAAVHDGVATGVQFSPVVADALAVAIERTCDLFADTATWKRLVRRAMSRNVGWERAAARYIEVYERLVASR
jgi:starch synthase